MRPFAYRPAADSAEAIRLAAAPGAQYFAGGTTLLDLMKLDVARPQTLVDVNALARAHGDIVASSEGLRLGGLARMADAAENRDVRRDYPAIAQSLQQAASAQLRNMASLAGNALQRTRCMYFRDVSWAACNKRAPGSGCAALGGVSRNLAILGASDQCIANYPGDFAVALVAFDASVDVEGPNGRRSLAFADLHRLPADAPHIETNLKPAELILGFRVAAAPWTRRSLYLKVRDRESYEFALASAAVALDLDGEVVREARVALGGLAAKPWRSSAAEQALRGAKLDEKMAKTAAEAAFAEAQAPGDRAFKVELGRQTLARALQQCAAMEI